MTHKYTSCCALKVNKDWPTAQGQPNFLRKLHSSQTFGFENAFCEFSAQWAVWIYFRGLHKPEGSWALDCLHQSSENFSWSFQRSILLEIFYTL